MIRLLDTRSIHLPENRAKCLVVAGVLIGFIALLDWWTTAYMSLLFLYMVPIALAAGFLKRWQIVGLSLFCSAIGERFSSLPFAEGTLTRIGIVAVAFAGTGLFVSELVRNRQQALAHVAEVEEQMRLRRGAEEELQMLIEGSPAAIITMDSSGIILMCNEAARRLFAAGQAPVTGEPVSRYLPGLQQCSKARTAHAFRTTMQTRARRASGEIFMAAVWLSTYETISGHKLAAIVVDLSDELRDREDLSLEHLLKSARILAGGMSHEIRNLCGAVSMVRRNLARVPALAGNEDFQALETLLEGLERIASLEFQPAESATASPVDLESVIDEFCVLIGTHFEEAGITLSRREDESLPLVMADRYALLQVFLNIANNARRAMEHSPDRRFLISASAEAGSVVVRLENSGPSVSDPDALFRPFQAGADGTGLGLYVSRTLLRPFRGDLRYEPREAGCCFAVVIPAVAGAA